MKKQAENFSNHKKKDKAFEKMVKNASGAITEFANKSKNVAVKSQETIVSTIDQNGNGQIDIEDIIILGLKVPGIRINRSEFLQKELYKNHTQEIIDDAIAYTPAHAQISAEEIDKLADEVIKFERTCVSGISAALCTPGCFALAATIPADRKSVV